MIVEQVALGARSRVSGAWAVGFGLRSVVLASSLGGSLLSSQGMPRVRAPEL